jgi:hypothetical protein
MKQFNLTTSMEKVPDKLSISSLFFQYGKTSLMSDIKLQSECLLESSMEYQFKIVLVQTGYTMLYITPEKKRRFA